MQIAGHNPGGRCRVSLETKPERSERWHGNRWRGNCGSGTEYGTLDAPQMTYCGTVYDTSPARSTWYGLGWTGVGGPGGFLAYASTPWTPSRAVSFVTG